MGTLATVLPSVAGYMAAAIQNTLAMVTQELESLNANLETIFLQAFNNWAAAVVAFKIPNANPPQPPMAYVIGPPDKNGFATIVPGTSPVCPMPALPTVPATPVGMVVAIGKQIPGTGFWAALPANANIPAGYTTPSPVQAADNVTGIFTWDEWPFGGWWIKVG